VHLSDPVDAVVLLVDPHDHGLELLVTPSPPSTAAGSGSFRASKVNRLARSRNSFGYFCGAGMLIPPWLDGLRPTR